MKKVVLVGHCGPDASYLRMAVASADKSIKVLSADDSQALSRVLDHGADLLLLNRVLDGDFHDMPTGIDIIRLLREKYPAVKMMMVSNYPEAHAAAVAVGGLAGFGKREIGMPKVGQLIRDALGVAVTNT